MNCATSRCDMKNMKTDFASKVRRIRSSLLHTRPFFAAVIRRLEWVVVDRGDPLSTMATNGRILKCNPKWIEDNPEAVGEWTHKHEAMHVVDKHHLRRKDRKRGRDRDPELWNIACDLAVNHLLQDERGWDAERFLLAGVKRFKDYPVGQSAEGYYELLVKEAKEQQNKQEEKQDQIQDSTEPDSAESEQEQGQQDAQDVSEGSDDQGQGEPETSDTGQSEASDGLNDPTEGPDGQEDVQDAADGGQNAGTAGGLKDALDKLKQEIAGQYDVGEVEQREPDEAAGETMDSLERDWKEVVASAAVIAQQQGKDPAWLMDAVSTALAAPRINWKAAMRRFARRMVNHGFNWKRLSRRHGWKQDVCMPARGSYGIARFLYVCDTSGSMTSEGLDQQFDAWNDILKDFRKVKMVIAQADTRVIPDTVVEITQRDLPLSAPKVRDWKWKGRGGTSFKEVFALAKKLRVKGVVYYTDGYGTFPDASEVSMPVLWVVTEDGADEDHFPFGEVVRFSE